MPTPYLGQIYMVSFNFAPKGFAMCNGQLLPINQNQALFSILGTTYGGDGRVNFALPNLQGCTPLHFGNGFTLGQKGGEQSVTLTINQLPLHTHVVNATTSSNTKPTPAGNDWATGGESVYAATSNAAMSASMVTSIGGSQPHLNMSPFLVINFVIALQGIFPSQN